MIVFGAAALYLWERTERNADVPRLAAHAESLSQAIGRELDRYRASVESLANSPELKTERIEPFWRYAQDVARHVGGHFALIDPAMQQRVNTNVAPGASLPPARTTASIKRVLDTSQSVITDFEPLSVSGKTQFAILAPVIDSAQVRYVLGFAPPPDAIQAILMQTSRPNGWLTSILDRRGVIIARSQAYDEFFGRPASADFIERISSPSGSTASTDLQGRVSTTAWRTTENGWKVIVWAPEDVLQQRTQYAAGALGLAALATLLVSLLASWFASRLVLGPMGRLVGAAHCLGEGQVVHFAPTRMKEANAIGASLSEASELIHRRESALRAGEAHTNLIMRELSHRSKNLLAMVQAMARQSARASSNFEDFKPRFIERLQSLSMSHDLLVKTDWTSVAMRDLIAEQMRPFIDQPVGKLIVSGENLMLKPEAAQNLGMVFHELGSNAVKHGSLSVPAGVVHIDWRTESDDRATLVLRWRETGGPPARPPSSRGFGTAIIEKLIPQSLQGEAGISWDEGGIVWTLRAPMSSITRAGRYGATRRASEPYNNNVQDDL